jgi:hypothetical protein
MVRQSEALSAWLSFFDSPRFGGVAVVVWGLVLFGDFGVNRRQMGKTVAGPAPTACVACGGEGRVKKVGCGVVLGCWPCAAVGVFIAYTYNFSIIMI